MREAIDFALQEPCKPVKTPYGWLAKSFWGLKTSGSGKLVFPLLISGVYRNECVTMQLLYFFKMEGFRSFDLTNSSLD